MTTDASRAHIDAETLAAWAEHRLSAEAAAVVELHLSNCDRCQEVLAAFVRSEPPAGAAILPFWSRRPVRWSAAGLAAAAAIVTMILIGRPMAPPPPVSTITLNDSPANSPTPPPAAVDQLRPMASPSAPTAESSAAVEARQVGKKRTDPSAGQKSARQESSKTSGALVGAGTAAAAPPPAAVQAMPAPPPPPPAVLAQAPPAQSPQATPQPRAGVAGGISTAAPAMASPRPATMAESLVAPEVVPVIEIAVPDQETLARRSMTAAGRGTAGGGATAARDAAANVAQVSWRIVRGTRVERTQDGGANWTQVTIEPELKTVLLAGSATSPANCWLVGRQGVVLITSDGRTFKRVSVPESVDLIAVTAQDTLRATVTTRDGRRFSTADGGQTWK